ncbi:uncharacterized protein FYW49_018078 [Xenentodon cancila]
MCALQLLRVSVHGRISAAAEDVLLQLGNRKESAELSGLRSLLTERLRTAAEEIVGLFEKAVAEYESRVRRSEQEMLRNAELKPDVNAHRAEVQQGRSSSPQLEDQLDPEPPRIKEEQDEIWTSQDEGFAFTTVPLKSEDEEEKPQLTKLHQSQTEEDGDYVGGPEPAATADSHSLIHSVVEDSFPDTTETDESDCDWTQRNKAQSSVDDVKNSGTRGGDARSVAKERPFPCSYCGKRFSLKGNLNRHIRDHTGERPFPCTNCDKSFKDSGSLTAHMRCHTGERPYSCLFCGKNFSGRGNMTRHMRIHTGEKPFTCSLCNKSFHVKEHLNRHIKYHTGEKPFRCTVCGKGCAQKTDLKKHMRVHTGEKPFSCPFCGKCCAEKGDLTKHVRVHTGEKPFSCSICGKSCAQKGSLKIHMRIHTGEKPFTCSFCGKCFIVTGHLKRHMKLHAAQCQLTNSADSPKTKTQAELNTNEAENASLTGFIQSEVV